MSESTLWTLAAVLSVLVAVVAMIAGSIPLVVAAIVIAIVTFNLPRVGGGGEPPRHRA